MDRIEDVINDNVTYDELTCAVFITFDFTVIHCSVAVSGNVGPFMTN